MKCLRMELKLRWSVTSVCVPVETGFAPLWPAMVGLYPHVCTKLKKCEENVSLSSLGHFFLLTFFCLSGEHHSQEIDGEGGEEEEMTEEEWSRRVTELKALQVAMSLIYYSLKMQKEPILLCFHKEKPEEHKYTS